MKSPRARPLVESGLRTVLPASTDSLLMKLFPDGTDSGTSGTFPVTPLSLTGRSSLRKAENAAFRHLPCPSGTGTS